MNGALKEAPILETPDCSHRLRSPLQLSGWKQFVKLKWDFDALDCSSDDDKKESELAGLLWADRRGLISQPPTIPYTPLFPTRSGPASSDRAWIERATAVAEQMSTFGTGGTIAFPPELVDVRPWQWNGFLANVAYTSRISLPHDLSLVDRSVRKQIAKAERAGYIVAPARSIDDVFHCLAGTEQKQRFQYGITGHDLKIATGHLGPENLRLYVCYSATGEPASARAVLCTPGTWAIDWLAGTSAEHRSSGATQFLINHVLEDLSALQAIGFDYGGANLQSIAAAKTAWGGRLTPFYRIRRQDLRYVAKLTASWLRQRLSR